MARLASTFEELRACGNGGLIAYVTVGYPTLEETVELVSTIAASGADVVELGVPFSDPLADGPTIRNASQVALRNGVTVRKCLEVVAALRSTGLETPLVLMGYCNPFLAYGVDRLARDAAAIGADGLIVPDLPAEEADPWLAPLRAAGLELIFFLAPTTPEARMKSALRRASGFLYCISTTGVTGARSELPTELSGFLGRVRSFTDLPLAVGFGISAPKHVKEVTEIADAAIVGSALISVIGDSSPDERLGKTAAFVAELKSATVRERVGVDG